MIPVKASLSQAAVLTFLIVIVTAAQAASWECEDAGARVRDVCIKAGGVPVNCGLRGSNEANECRKRQDAHEKMMEKKKLPSPRPAEPYVPVGPGPKPTRSQGAVQ